MAEEPDIQFARDPELERARQWWRAHGRSIVVGLALGLGAVVGFNYWQSQQATQSEEAAILFERLQDAIAEAADNANESATETDSAAADPAAQPAAAAGDDASAPVDAVRLIADDLMRDYEDTPYAAHAAFAVAKIAVTAGDLERAAESLAWALENSAANELRHIARLRLAAIRLAQNAADAALALLEVPEEGFRARYLELRGDAELQRGNIQRARSAYESSLEALSPASAARALVQLKLDNLGG